MSIVRKIYLLLGTIIGIFSMLQAYVIVSNLSESHYLRVQQQATTLSIAVNLVVHKAKGILIGSGKLNRLTADFTDSLTACLKAQADLAGNPDLANFGAEISGTINSIGTPLESVSNTMKTLIPQVEALPDSPGLSSAASGGLYRMRGGLSLVDLKGNGAFLLDSRIDEITSSTYSLEGAVMPLLDNLAAAIGDVVEQRRTATFIVILAATLIIFALNLFIGLSFTRRFGQRVRSLLSIMAKAADGNISGRYSDRSKDEVHLLGEGLNKVLASLRDFLVRAGGAVSSAKDLGNHLSGSSTETATAFNEISENVASMRRQVENLDGMMRETAENATGLQSSVERLNGAINSQQLVVTDSKSRISEMNGAIGATRSATNQALEETRKLVEATSVVNTKSQETGELVTLVGNDIESVAEFIALINDIADKTNILSLNAAIQSAHAGEAGKGFAVVAQEIQKLAETSRENALRIGERLHGMTENIRQVETISKENQVAVAGVHVGIQDFAIYQEKIGNQMEGLVTEGRTILSAFQELDGISSTVAEGAHDMDERSTAIASTARVAAQHCSEILNGIREIEQGNGDILASLSGVQDTARDSQQAVTELESGMAAFQVDDDL